MGTNIDLSSPEVSEKKVMTGKSALIFSVILLLLVVIASLALIFLKSKYSAEDKSTSDQILQEQNKVSGSAFADIIDFQGRLNLADKTINDHAYWDSLAKRFSSYIIPEVKLTKFSGKTDTAGEGIIDVDGTAASLDALSRELILLKDFPGLESLEFKNAGEKAGQVDQPGGIFFSASLKVNKSAFQK